MKFGLAKIAIDSNYILISRVTADGRKNDCFDVQHLRAKVLLDPFLHSNLDDSIAIPRGFPRRLEAIFLKVRSWEHCSFLRGNLLKF